MPGITISRAEKPEVRIGGASLLRILDEEFATVPKRLWFFPQLRELKARIVLRVYEEVLKWVQ